MPPERREAAGYLVAEHGLSKTKACAAVGLSRAAFYRIPRGRSDDGEIIEALNALVEQHIRWGFWKCFDRLRLDGHRWNHKRVLRVYRTMRLNLTRRTKKRLPTREPHPIAVESRPGAVWGIDFMSDSLYSGRRFRTFNILDEGVREALDIVIDTSIPAKRVVRTLENLVSWHGAPEVIRCDNGPEFLAEVFVAWCERHQILIRYIQPGKPNQNAYVERFNRIYRGDVLNAYLFETLDQVRNITNKWLRDYNERRPHDALGRIPPSMFRRGVEAGISTLALST